MSDSTLNMEKGLEGEGGPSGVGTTELGEAGFGESAEFGQETADQLEGPPRDR